jgi:S1-C subfamily serine protease
MTSFHMGSAMRSPSGTIAKIVSENGGTSRARVDSEGADGKSSDLRSTLATAYVYGVGFIVALLVSAVSTTAIGCASNWKGSVGAVLGKDNRTGRVFVRDAPPGMPAERAGIRPDDEITAIDDVPVGKMTPEQVHEKLAGDVGTKVKLTVLHAGDAPRDVLVERGPLRNDAK